MVGWPPRNVRRGVARAACILRRGTLRATIRRTAPTAGKNDLGAAARFFQPPALLFVATQAVHPRGLRGRLADRDLSTRTGARPYCSVDYILRPCSGRGSDV